MANIKKLIKVKVLGNCSYKGMIYSKGEIIEVEQDVYDAFGKGLMEIIEDIPKEDKK